MFLSLLHTLILFSITFAVSITTRLILILPRNRPAPVPRNRNDNGGTSKKTHLLIVLGSGGHTAEMLTMLSNLDTTAYQHRTYIISEGDPISATKAVSFETSLQDKIMAQLKADYVRPSKAASDLARAHYGSYVVATIPRARRVHQSLVTAPWSCLLTLRAAVQVLLNPQSSGAGAPDLILTNGPATSAIVIFASILLRFLGVRGHTGTRIIYVESFARVTTLSLSAKFVSWAVDRLLVQWRELEGKAGGRAEYAGLLALANLLPGETVEDGV